MVLKVGNVLWGDNVLTADNIIVNGIYTRAHVLRVNSPAGKVKDF
jgi:hypothetical protein